MRRFPTAVLLVILGAMLPATAQEYERGPARSPHGRLAAPCANCHTSTSWSPLRGVLEFNHNSDTRFALRGAHESVTCRLCHTSLVFQNVGSKCSDCHADIHRRQFGAACEGCHTVQGWRVAVQSIRAHQNRFPLMGAHSTAACESCHKGAATAGFTGRSTECSSCHLKNYQEARPLDHPAANLPLTCNLCHGMDNWTRARFDHAQFTRFPLDAAHANVDCVRCHTGGAFHGTSQECFSCHSAEFAAARPVDHVKAGFPKTCLTCHNAAAWTGARFDHAAMSRFPLAGAHQQVNCASCHANGVYAGTRQDCYGCHAGNYAATKNPDHTRSAFPTNCADCHTTAGWPGARFDHASARFQLTGAHVQAACTQCHAGGQFTGTNSLCAGCHLADFNRAANPNHVTAGFTQECASCHTTARWTGVSFDHGSKTRFALTGAHAQVNCTQCHVGDRFAGTVSQCVGCHLGEYQKAANPNHATAGFPQDCTSCHTTAKWTGAAFDHNTKTRFALTGAHVQPACAQCHAGGRFAGTPSDCVGCHLTNFQRTANPNHAAAGFSQDCVSCHTTARWTGAAFDHNRTKFMLTGAHTQVACAQCHVGDRFAGTGTQCVGCHLATFQRTTNPNHVTAGFPQDCTTCHTTARWTGAVFDHGRTKFMLTGAHTQVACAQCHVGGKFAGTATDCVGCHLTTFQRTTTPSHAAAGFPQDCTACHTTARWMGAAFDHTARTRFTLTGAHTQVACAQCHVGGKYAGTPSDCVGCHLTTFQRTTNPNHVSAGFPQTCTTCHTTARWTGSAFDHTARTRFTLTGAHTQVACAQCHVGGKYAGTPTDCVGCHLATFQRTTNPNHVSAGFPQTCTTCHTTARWTGSAFDHAARTRFTLTGAHTQVACAQCHVGGKYAGTPSDCVGCHLTTFQRTTNPNHVNAGFPQTCTTCHTTARWTGSAFDHTARTRFTLTGHTTARWTGSAFDHTARTRFTLTGAHTQVACAQCHVGGKYAGTPSDCVGCHLTTFQRTTNPNHVTAGFPQTCTNCHTTARWTGATFGHSASTRFALTGAHAQVACAQCHTGGRYAGTPTDCVGCHLTTFQGTTNPNHVTAGFPQTCTTCHTTTGWRPSTFSHASTRFALTGAHVPIACAQCHVGGRFAGTPTDCVGCHLTTFQRTTNPNHVSAGFPQTCASCHTAARWTGATFNHSAGTRFALTGAHVQVACAQCHVGGRYAGTPTDCVGCHLTTFQGTTNPSHVTAGFPQTCTTCHTTTGWRPSTFSHASTRFALTGAHVPVACAQCHVGGRYTGTSTECAGCHLATFQRTTNPNHVTAGFPQTCTTCHTTARWTGATFNHSAGTRFALTGAHVQVACAQCHVGGRYAGTPTDCVGCHLTTFQGTTNPNHVTAGFPQTCTTCHTTTGWRPSTFSHASTRFALTGAHVPVACAQCHVGGRYAGTPTECAGCHLTTFQRTTNPNHVSAGFPQTCASCHTTARWTGATFNHSAGTRFALTGAHVQVACAQCHVGGRYAGTPTDCVGCHLTTFQGTTNPSHVTAGFPQTCTTCHTTTGWRPSTFSHATTRFALTGAHVQVACAQCHVGGRYAGTPTNCVGCHLTTFQGTTNPNHVAAGFPQDCSLCHSTTRWTGATFNHSTTRFPLVGRHTSVACSGCHTGGVYTGLASTCVSCHLANYQRTTNPNHTTSGFPQQCEVCHTPSGWTPSSYSHSSTRFPLTGRHTSVACANCHVGGRYAGTPTDCYSCHRALYTSVTDPNHAAAGFPTTCQTCHTTSGWSGATFNHTAFPITSGAHRGRTCAECHTNPSNYQVFTCLTCHSQTSVDSEHRGRSGYVYNSANCYSCHRNGRAD